MKALIKVGYGCNEHCSFCHTLDVRHIDAGDDEVSTKIRRAKALGHTMVVLSGGEPTIRPELMTWAKRVAALDMDFGLVTNGQLLGYPEVVEQLLALRLRYVYMSLHGGTPQVHNRLVRADGFDQTYRALDNLSGNGLDLSINCVVTRHNVDHLRDLVDAVLPYPDVGVKFSMVEPKGGGNALFAQLMPRVAYAADKVKDAMVYGDERASPDGPRFAHGGFPLCLMEGYEDRYADLKTDQFWTMIEVGEPDFYPVDDKNKLQPAETCTGCALSGPCPGLYRGYFETFGGDELRAQISGPRSNSFNYAFEARVRPSTDGTCPVLRIGVTPWDRGRHLFVANGDRIARFRADTRDFSDVEIEHIKHDGGQLYLDMSTKDAPDDFQSDLVKLARSELCAPCPERPHCTGLYTPVLENVFGDDDAVVRGWLAELTGDVLDVGCGEGPYDDVLGPLATVGTIRYTGVDPDPARIETARAHRPWGTLKVGSIEDLDPNDQYDHVLALRSWNHFPDGPTALQRLKAACRPGGLITIIDNVAFGLARTRRQTAQGETGAAVFEHYRNDSAGDVHVHAERLGLELVARRDVGPGTSNQWALRYRLA
jgi:MoaA/NifB/PqqE/SkfB family radical SAM enzyme/2-polyprenyl-3-methyl-5-hydroxy-6-metoxy-1,4-benzoquinol methylase